MLDLIELVHKCLWAPCIPSISYKPSADCAYSMLVNKIKDRHIKLTEHGSGPSSPGEGIGHDDNTSDTHPISAPPPDIQVIIDKMASYVLKNGRDFESVVRSKGDERFAFLDIGHKYHPYYKHKVSVYQGLEHPLNFNKTTVSASNTAKRNQSSVKKPLSPEKKQRPILLPGYEYSDDSSESDEDPGSGESRGKLKIAPVSFSIKKPKEAEILKDVKSALPVEEESSEGEAEVESDATPKVPTATPDIQATHNGQENGDTTSSNPEEEMKRLQQLLKEKELQLREKERLRKISEKRSQDIFQIEAVEASAVPPLPTVLHPPASSLTNNIADGKTDVTEDFSQKALVTIKDDEYNSRESSGARPDAITDEGAIKLLVADKIVNEIAEAEVIDLTEDVDDLPKVSDTTRLERKRKAAAFLSRLQTDHRLHKNGNTHQTSDSDATSRHSTPSPTRLKRDKVDTSSGHFHEASIPRTSLMTRLAASTHMPRQPGAEKPSISKENARSHQKSESPAKPQKEREDRPHYRHKSKRRKSSSPSDVEDESPRALSRSMSYSRSPSHKRRQGEESDLEHRSHRHHKGDKSSRRKRQDTVESAERHHRRHGEERRGQQSYSLSGRGRDRGGGRERGHGHCHSKKIDMQVSDSDSSN